MTQPIRNLLLDLGAVLIDIDFARVADSFQRLGVTDFQRRYSQLQADTLFADLETGHVSETEFYSRMARESGLPLEPAAIRDAWNSILLDFRHTSLDWVMQQRKQYRVYLLSNTNAIHLACMNEKIRRETKYNELDLYFDRAYFSHRIGWRKPGRDAFDFVVQDAGLRADETLFVDDTLPNIETARAMGFQTHCLRPDERLETTVQAWLNH